MKKNVVVYSLIPESLRAELAEQFNLTVVTQPNGDGRAALIEALRDAHGTIGVGVKFDEALLAHAPKLEVVAAGSAGVDSYDVDALTRHGVMLTNVPSAVTESTADVALTLMLCTARRAIEMSTLIREGKWEKSITPAQFGVDVHGKRLGIIGLGRIGTAVAKRGHHGFGMQVLYNANSRKPEQEASMGAQYRDLPALLAESDFVVLTVPLSDATKGLIGRAELAMMKPTGILINIARGPVVDEAALIEALQERRIGGAGLDVFEHEPLPGTSPLASLSNVVALPHIGSATQETRDRMARDAASNLIEGLAGRRPTDLVNPEALDAA